MKCQDLVLLTIEEIAERWGVSRMRIWQIEQRALLKIRKAIEAEARHRGVTVKEWLFD